VGQFSAGKFIFLAFMGLGNIIDSVSGYPNLQIPNA
jgi:hypothetical protein